MIIILNNNQVIIEKSDIIIRKYNNFNINNYICVSINNIIYDFESNISNNSSVYFINLNNKKSLNIIRHSCAHLLAHAITNLYNNVKLAFGPVIKDGFYYDFLLDKRLTNDDLSIIENEMKRISECNINILRFSISFSEANKLFKNEPYKIEILHKLKNKNITYYKQDNFIDLCLGPHIKNTNILKYFKLLKISGAYWNNNKKNKMLYRIYGTAWESYEKLTKYCIKLDNIKKYDHKKLGHQLCLFDFYNYAPGVVFWNKNGWIIYKKIINYIRCILKSNRYIEVNTPMMLNISLFNKSGHMNKFNKYIFQYKDESKNISVLKPMNCPCHISIFQHFNKKSYKDLPFRIAEFGSCFRNELSGTLLGLMRLKNFTQDDGHIFCNESHIYYEIKKFIYILKKVYYKFGFYTFKVVLSKRPNGIKENNIWIKAENILEQVIKDLKIKYTISNEGAFYGPKLEFSLKDNIDRIWQCGTIQVDFFTAKKLNTSYINESGNSIYPIILHRAILGSIERFLGILIENNSGYLPFWITPIQIEILYINDLYLFYAKNVYNLLKIKYRVRMKINNERLEYKIKKCILEKILYIIVLGKKEYSTKTISIRQLNSKIIKNMSLNKFITKFKFCDF